jgi:hypothetical protein
MQFVLNKYRCEEIEAFTQIKNYEMNFNGQHMLIQQAIQISLFILILILPCNKIISLCKRM